MELKLVVLGGKQAGKTLTVPGPTFLIGRGEDCQLRPQSSQVSRRHCAVLLKEGHALVQDFKSTNGTFVNGEKVEDVCELKNGDRLKVGAIEFEIQLAVSIGGAKKPKVHNVHEAAVRTVAAAPAKDEDLDITGWLEDEDDISAGTTILPAKTGDTAHGNLADTVALSPLPPTDPKAKKQEPKKHGPKFKVPVTGDSQLAASNVLRQFFSKKKP